MPVLLTVFFATLASVILSLSYGWWDLTMAVCIPVCCWTAHYDPAACP